MEESKMTTVTKQPAVAQTFKPWQHEGNEKEAKNAANSGLAVGQLWTPEQDESEAQKKRSEHEWRAWYGRCAAELKKTDGLSVTERFFGAAFSLLAEGGKLTDLEREIDETVDNETCAEKLEFFFRNRLKDCGLGTKVALEKYAAEYFSADKKRDKKERFHNAVLFLLEEGFSREELHKLVSRAVEI
jgi:hypothetical protein